MFLTGVVQDFRCAFRYLRGNPGYTFTATLCLALAMGVNTTLLSFIDSVLFRGLPVPQSRQIVVVSRMPAPFCMWRQYPAVRANLQSVDAAAFLPASTLVDVDGNNLHLTMEIVSANYSHVLRVGTTAGTWFTPEADSPGTEPTAVISHDLWSHNLNSDPSIVGRRILVQEMSYRIAGVAAPGFRGSTPPIGIDLWVPVGSLLRSDPEGIRSMVNLVGRLKGTASLPAAKAEIDLIDARLMSSEPRNAMLAGPVKVERAAGFLWANGRESVARFVPLMCVVCGTILLIACVNLAGLMFSRSAVLRRDIALRKALGATRWQLFRGTLVEALMLAAAAIALGVPIGYACGQIIQTVLPDIPIASGLVISFDFSWRVALLLATIGVVSAVLFSLPPSFSNPGTDLMSGIKGDAGGHKWRQGELCALGQVTLSLVLLVGTGLIVRSLIQARRMDLGFATERRLYVTLYASPRAFRPDAARQTFTTVLARVRNLPGVKTATLASAPLGPAGAGNCATPSPAQRPTRVALNVVDPSYFEVMRVPLITGGVFSASNTQAIGPQSVIVNETLARSWWSGEDPIGKTLWLGCRPPAAKIAHVVGVARDTKSALGETVQPGLYVSRAEEAGNGAFALIVQTAGEPHLWAKPLLDIARSSDPKLRTYEVTTFDEAVALSLWQLKWEAVLAGVLGFLSVLLAAIGLYGVLAYAVSRRTREIGVRVALGATPGQIEVLMLSQALRIAAFGIFAGLLLSAAIVPVLRHTLHGLGPFDPFAFSVATILWLVVAILAGWYPARRATRLQAVTALKHE